MTMAMLTVLLLLLAVCAGSAQQPLQLSNVCHPPGSASAWFETANGNLLACAGAIESNGTQALYVPDIGAPIIVVMPPGVGAGINASTSSPRCLFATDRGSKDLVPIILTTYTAEGEMRQALLCPVPALSDSSFPGGGGGPPPEWVNLYTKLDNALPFYPINGLALWFFGLTAPPVPTVTWAAGGALITLQGFNLAVPGAGGSGGEGGEGGTAAASAALTGAAVGMTCRFYLAPNSSATSYTAPWHLQLATSGAEPLGSTGRDSLALSVTRTTAICQLPPMPSGFIPKQGSVYVSVSPDPHTISFCLPRNLSLFTPIATSTSVARSSQEGGFLLTVVGQGFPPPGLPSSTPSVSFGSTAVAAAFAGETALVCTVPAHAAGKVAIALSFDGQTFARGDATFSFYQTVVISQVSPTIVPHTGKSVITCMGSNFQPMTSKHRVKCRFTDMGPNRGGSVYYTSGKMSADGSAVCPTPAIAVTFGTWEHSLALSFNFEGNPAPQWSQGAQMYIYASPIVNRTTPRLISGIGGTTVSLIGTNFKDTSTAACWFGSGQQRVSVLGNVISDTLMKCVMPATPDKSSKVPVCVSINGVDCSDSFDLTIYAVKHLFPTAVPQSGGSVNVSLNAPHQPGELFISKAIQCDGKACVRCRFRAPDGWIVFGAVTAVFDDVIVCSVGALLQLGSQHLELSLNGGVEANNGDWFTGNFLQVYEVPRVTSTFPCTGPVSGGSVVTLRGQNFYKSESLTSLCSFGGINSVATLSDCETAESGVVVCTTAVCSSAASNDTAGMQRLTQPESAAGQGAYDVKLSLLLNSVQPNAVSSFLYYKVPAMLSLTPSFCPNTGSSLVTINGRDLTGGYNGTRFCRFMPSEPSNHEMLFLDPQSTAMPHELPQPMVTAAHYTKRGTQLVCPCPNNRRVKQQYVRLVVSLNGQQYDGEGLAAAVGAPVTLHATTPLSGDVQGSSIVYATGANFMQGAGLQMIFGTQSVPATVVRAGVVKAYSPASVDMELGKVSVWVSNGGSDRSSTSTIFEYFSSGLGCPVEKQSQKTCHWSGLDYGACVANECQCSTGYWGRACSLVPQTASVFPLSGLPGGGTLVSVRGLFLGGECCSLASEHASVPFPVNPQPASQLKVRTSNLVVSATYESFNDALRFSAPDYPEGSVINLEVSFDGGARYITAPDSFRYEQGPLVTDFYPTTSPLGGDTVITIRGSRFWDNVALSCKFGSAGETRALWISTSMIKCATSPYFVRPAATPKDFNSDDNADVKTCAGYNSAACVTEGRARCIWYQASCIPVYTYRNVTTGSQVFSVSTNGQEYISLPMPIHYYNESSVFCVQPTFGPVTGGTIVTITGPPDFIPSPESNCRFDKQIVPGTVTASSVRCTSPRVATGSTARVATGSTVEFAVALDGQHFVCVPSTSNGHCNYFFFETVEVSRVFPSIGSTLGGLPVTVTGLAFLPVPTARCRFGSSSTLFSVFASTSGVCVTPAASAAGPVQFAITINGVDEQVLATGFHFYIIPKLSRLSPNGAALHGGASITVAGKTFLSYADHVLLCRFTLQALQNSVLTQQHAGNSSASVVAIPLVTTVSGDREGGQPVSVITSVVCAAPQRNSSGSYSLQVSLIGIRTSEGLVAPGDEWSAGLDFTYYPLPSMYALRPVVGGMRGGTAVLAILSDTVSLEMFARCVFENQGGKSVYIQGYVVSQNSVGCAAPAYDDVNDMYPTVRVALNGQDLTVTKSHVFSYVDEGISLAVAPTVATTMGGSILRVTGSNFATSFWASCVFRGSTTVAVPATIVSSVQARCVSPPLPSPGTYQLAIAPSETFEGTSLPILVVWGARVSRLEPSHGLLQGGTSVTLVGTQFAEQKAPICLFGLRMVQGRWVDKEHIVCRSPPSPVQRLFRVQVIVSLDGGVNYFNTTKTYEYYPLLKVLDFYPQLGVIQGGTTVTVSAAGVRNVSGSMCRFGSKQVSATILSNSATGVGVLTCVSPAYVQEFVNFALSHNGQDKEFAQAASSYTFHRPLVARDMWPTAGPFAGGTLVTLAADQGSRTHYPMGADFVQRATLLPPDPMPTSQWVYCKIDEEMVPGRQVVDGVECRVSACSGVKISKYTSASGANASGLIRRMQVSVNGQEFASLHKYSFLCASMPVVERVVPSMGPSQVGSRITMYGSNFTGTTRSRCAVGNLSSPAVVVNSTTAYCDALPTQPMNLSQQSRPFVVTATSSSTDGNRDSNSLGIQFVSLAVDGQHYSKSNLASYIFYPSVAVVKIEPQSATTTQGPLTITVYGSGFQPHSDAYAQCRFGSVVVRAYVNTSETLECSAPAVSSGGAVLVELAFNRRDFEKHNSVFFLRLAPAPLVASVTFDEALNHLKIRWHNATDRGTFRSSSGADNCGSDAHKTCSVIDPRHLVGPFDCGEVMASSGLLGDGVMCRWQDNNTLVVSMGANPTLKPGQSLSLLPSAVMQGSQLSYYTAAQLPAAELPSRADISSPRPVILAPAAVGACEDIVIDASMSYNSGGRPLNFSWTLISPPASAPFSVNISEILRAFSGPERDASRTKCAKGVCSKITIPNALLTPQDYTLSLSVTSWVGLTSSATVTVTKSTDTLTPSVLILAARALHIRPGNQVQLQASATHAACSALSSTATLSLKWSVQETLAGGVKGADVLAPASIFATSHLLRIPAHMLSASKVYTIEVSATAQSGNVARAATTVTVAAGALVAWISGGDRQAAHNQDLWLDASRSFDPDVKPSDNAAALMFAWRCEMLDLESKTSQSCAAAERNFTLADSSKAVTYVPLGSAAAGERMCSGLDVHNICHGGKEFVFSVSVSREDGSGIATAAVRVRFARANTTAVVNISSTPCISTTGRCKINVAHPLTLLASLTVSPSSPSLWVTNWTTLEGDVDISRRDLLLTDAGLPTLVLRGNVLTEGAAYVFRFSARRAHSDMTQGGYAEIVVQCNAPPNGGRFLIDHISGTALRSNFSLTALGWSDDAEDMPLTYSFYALLNTSSANTSPSVASSNTKRTPILASTLIPHHMVRLPVGPAPLYTVDIVLEIYDSLGAAAVQRGCVLAESDFSTQHLPCRVRVEPPGSTPDAVLELVRDVGVSLLERAVGTGNFEESLSLAGVMLSLLNSPTMQGASASRRQAGSQLTRFRAVRDVIADSLAAQINPSLAAQSNPAFAHLLPARTLSAAATTLKYTAYVPKQVSPSAQRLLLSCGSSILSSSALHTTSTTEDLGATTSLLREALEYSKIDAKEVSDTEALEQQDRLEAMLLSLSRKALASHTAGQDGLTMVFSTFVTFGRVFPVVRSAAGGMATLKTQLTVQLGGFYHEWGERFVSVIMPDVSMADTEVKLPSDASANGAAVELIVSVWRGNASWVRGGMGHAPAASLLGQYVQVSLHWHGRDSEDGKISIHSLPSPVRMGITTRIPDRSIHPTTGRQSVVATCVYLGPSGRTWHIDGMSLALNSSSASPFVAPSSATAAGSVREAVVCEASHLTSFTVVAEEAGCDGVPRSLLVLDRCTVCGGNNACLDCDSVPFGKKTLDPCGICGGSNKLETCLGCDGRIYAPGAARAFDACQVCGGNGNHRGCDGECNSGLAADECGVCGGDGTSCAAPGEFEGSASTILPKCVVRILSLSLAVLLSRSLLPP